MDTERKRLLNRWNALHDSAGLRRAGAFARVLWLIGVILLLVVVFGLYYRFPTAVVAGVAAVMGWVIAESNALRARISQWPVVQTYIKWDRVSDDLARLERDA